MYWKWNELMAKMLLKSWIKGCKRWHGWLISVGNWAHLTSKEKSQKDIDEYNSELIPDINHKNPNLFEESKNISWLLLRRNSICCTLNHSFHLFKYCINIFLNSFEFWYLHTQPSTTNFKNPCVKSLAIHVSCKWRLGSRKKWKEGKNEEARGKERKENKELCKVQSFFMWWKRSFEKVFEEKKNLTLA